LVDLGPIEDQSLSDHVRLRAFLKALKYARRQDLPSHLYAVLAEAPVLNKRDLLVILTYLKKGPVMSDSKLIHQTLQDLAPELDEQFLDWFSQPYYDRGEAKGIAEGKAALLLRFLEKRFRAIPPSVRERILTADVASIETWADRVFDAPDIQSVFASN
jgi:hypothetical protein